LQTAMKNPHQKIFKTFTKMEHKTQTWTRHSS
jgi:hypothetical protein